MSTELCSSLVISNIQSDEAFTYTVIQEKDGVVSHSKTFTTDGEWDYSPPPVTDQFNYQTGGNWASHATEILAQGAVLDRGYCLDYLCGDGKLAYESVRQSQLVVIGVEDTQQEVDAARAFLSARGVYGSRVTVVRSFGGPSSSMRIASRQSSSTCLSGRAKRSDSAEESGKG